MSSYRSIGFSTSTTLSNYSQSLYTGSWERYFAKNDTRRSERAYHAKAHVGAGHDHWMSPWLSGFVQQAGSERAKELLQPYVVADTNITNASSVFLSLSLELPGRTASK
jgi:hypothetical protein